MQCSPKPDPTGSHAGGTGAGAGVCAGHLPPPTGRKAAEPSAAPPEGQGAGSMTEHIIRQQGAVLQKGAATEDRQEKKTARSGVRQVPGGRRAPAGAGASPVPLPQDPGILPVGRGKTAVRGVEEKSPVKERLDGKKALPYGNAFAFGKQMVNVVSWSEELCA